GASRGGMVGGVMKGGGGGAVVNFSSIAGKFANAGRMLYPASKAAIRQITRNEAIDLAPHRIRVNCVSPAWTWSDPLRVLSGDSRELADKVGARLHPLRPTPAPAQAPTSLLC